MVIQSYLGLLPTFDNTAKKSGGKNYRAIFSIINYINFSSKELLWLILYYLRLMMTLEFYEL